MVGKCCCIIIGCLVGCLIVFIGVTTLVYFLVFHKALPKALVHYEVTNASLTKFNLTADNTFLDYNLSLKLTLENPIALNYNLERLEAMPVFKSQNLNQDMTNLSKPFSLGHESNVTLPVEFSGNHSVAFGAQEASDIGKADVFDIVLKIISEYSPETKKKNISYKQEVTCNLKVPLNSNGTSSGDSFQITKCDATKLDINED